MSELKSKYTNRVVVISGASGGLGKVVARQFASSGAKVVLAGKNAEKLEALGMQLDIPQDRWMSVAVDLTNEEAVSGLLTKVLTKIGKVDILIHLVCGWIGGKPLEEVKIEDVSEMIDQHILSTFFAAQAFIPKLVENKWGRIIVISSPSAGIPPANNLPYSVAKAGQEALILTLSEELRGSGVTANIVRVKTIDVNHEKEHSPSSKNAAWTTPEEITDMIMYLCSESAGMVNGARIPLYGSQ
jgi:NAD(P)-dependent dehydrogenase (short-subunit alcohol dehydrogenase family)